MSDYLWDKTGEPDAEVERLENLLGELRFQSTPFDLPAGLPARAHAAPRAVNKFSWTRLAVAASLLLTLLAGAWLVSISRRATDAPEIAIKPTKDAVAPQPAQQPEEERVAAVSGGDDETTAQREDQKRRAARERVVSPQVSREPRRDVIRVAVVKRPGAQPRHSNKREVNARRDELASNGSKDAKPITNDEKKAMGQLMLALKVTSEKLGYAERQVQGLSEGSPRR